MLFMSILAEETRFHDICERKTPVPWQKWAMKYSFMFIMSVKSLIHALIESKKDYDNNMLHIKHMI